MLSHQLEKMWEEYYPKVFGYFYRRVNTREDVEDLTSIVMQKFLDVMSERGEEIKSPNGYLWKMANNQLNYFINTKSKLPISVSTSEEYDSIDTSLDNYRSQNYKQKVESLMDCIKKVLKGVDFEIIKESLVEDKKSYEVAGELGLTADNVRQRLSRGLAKVRKKCGDLWFEKT